MKKIRLEIAGITYSQTQSGSYVLTLSEVGGIKKLPIVIGGFEAQAIAIELEKMSPNRPLTHDLFKSFCESYSVTVAEVIIYKFYEGVFYAKIICLQDGLSTEIDSRTSDAIAIGVRFDCPIYSYKSILDDVGSTHERKESDRDEFEDEDQEQLEINDPSREDFFTEINETIEEMKLRLQDAINQEDYELASYLRDEIAKKSIK